MTSIKLYQVSDQYQQILSNLYDQETGEVNQEVLDQLKSIQEPLEKKCISVASYIKNIDLERKMIEEAKKALAERESKFKKRVEDMKEYLLFNMEKVGIKKITSPYFDITLCKNPVSVDLYDEARVPDDYNKVTIEKDKSKVKAALLNGVLIPGARLIQKNSIRIK